MRPVGVHVAAERQALERLLAVDPSDRSALDRLAQLAEQDGQEAQAAEIGHKKVEIDRLRARYEKRHDRKQPIRDAVEMAHLAEQLGRIFEARVFLTLAVSEDPERDDSEARTRTTEPGSSKGRGATPDPS